MSEPNENETASGGAVAPKKVPPSRPSSARGALFQSSADADAVRPRGRLVIGAGSLGALLLGGGYAYHRYQIAQAPPPASSEMVVEPPPPAEGPLLPLDAVVRVEGGTFQMGSMDGDEDERPVLEQKVATLEIDLTEVTVAAYRACVEAGKCAAPATGPGLYCNWGKPGRDRHPVNCVDARQAAAYCAFVGKRLPTEPEWEYAARGGDGHRYPWKEGPPAGQLCWNGEGNNLGKNRRQGTCAVGRYPAGAAASGALDMAGNVWEWTATAYCPSYEGRDCAQEVHVIRGGGWNNLKESYVRAQDRSRESVKSQVDNVGLRCARTPK